LLFVICYWFVVRTLVLIAEDFTLEEFSPHYSHLAPFSRTGFPACSTKSEFSCEAGKPVPKKLIENGATSQHYKLFQL